MTNTLKFLVLLACLFPALAVADDLYETTIPGTACKLYQPQANDTFMNPSGLSANGLKNTSASAAKVVCPITKIDSNFNNSKNSFYSMVVFMSSSAGNAQFYSRKLDGTDYDVLSPVEIGPAGNMYYYWINGSKRNTFGRSVAAYMDLPAGANITGVNYEDYLGL
jgi:hypothetical protein